MSGTGSVPGRRPISWPPPYRIAVSGRPHATTVIELTVPHRTRGPRQAEITVTNLLPVRGYWEDQGYDWFYGL